MRSSAYVLAVLLSLSASVGFSQKVGSSYDLRDSSLIPSKRMPQHTEFLNGTYNYPAKPRSQWEVGVKAGLFQISNNIQFHKTNSSLTTYAIAGGGAAIYETRVNALNGDVKYNFNTLTQPAYKDRQDFLKNLKNNILDGSFETPAESHGSTRPQLGDKTMRPVGTFGFGVAFKLNDRINLAIEDRWTITRDDLLDGQRWQEFAWGDASLTPDFDTYNYMTVGLNINLGKNAVQPLYWLNPLDYPYAELRNPRLMNIPKPVLLDTDGDGVTDQFDREQTPAGCPVDTHGVSLDTDGDGVPDCKDKELITPTRCQPVDVDGVGNCKCPDDCKVAVAPPPTCEQKLGALPSVAFKAGSNKLGRFTCCS